jgi:hypothetical protein
MHQSRTGPNKNDNATNVRIPHSRLEPHKLSVPQLKSIPATKGGNFRQTPCTVDDGRGSPSD